MSVNPSPRPRQNGVAIACILSGGLIAAAIIDSHRPTAPVAAPITKVAEATSPAGATVEVVATRATPPIAQESAKQQFEQQMNAQVQIIKPVREGATDYYFKGVKVTRVDYSAKDDTLTLIYSPRWQSSAGRDSEYLDGVTDATATSDGYGHYDGSANLGGAGAGIRYVDFVLR